MDLDLVLLGHGAPHRVGGGVQIHIAGALGLVDDDEALGPASSDFRFNGKRRPAAGAQGRMGALGGPLDVLGVVVAAAQDDQLLAPACDEQLAPAGRAPKVSAVSAGRFQ